MRRRPWGTAGISRLEVPGAVIRPVSEADAAALLATCPAMIRQHVGGRRRVTLESATAFIAALGVGAREGESLGLAVVPRGGDRLIGVYHIWRVGDDEVGFEAGLGFPFWGAPLFGQWTSAVIDYCVDSLGARRVFTRLAPENVAGQVTLLRLGAVKGVRNDAWPRWRRCRSRVGWSISSDEWLDRRVRARAIARSASMEILNDEFDVPGSLTEPDEGGGLFLVSESSGLLRTARDNPSCCAPPEDSSTVFPEDGY